MTSTSPGLADWVRSAQLNANDIVPSVFDPVVAPAVAAAVRKATSNPPAAVGSEYADSE